MKEKVRRIALADLDRQTACSALYRASLRRGLSQRRAAEVESKCMAAWRKPPKKKPNPKYAHCPLRTVEIRRKDGTLVATFQAHKCPPKGRTSTRRAKRVKR